MFNYTKLCNNFTSSSSSNEKEVTTKKQDFFSFNSQECYGECSNFDYTNSDHFYSSSPSTLINSPNQKQRSVRRCICERGMTGGVEMRKGSMHGLNWHGTGRGSDVTRKCEKLRSRIFSL